MEQAPQLGDGDRRRGIDAEIIISPDFSPSHAKAIGDVSICSLRVGPREAPVNPSPPAPRAFVGRPFDFCVDRSPNVFGPACRPVSFCGVRSNGYAALLCDEVANQRNRNSLQCREIIAAPQIGPGDSTLPDCTSTAAASAPWRASSSTAREAWTALPFQSAKRCHPRTTL